MLRFAARHGIKPVLEKFPMTVEGINAAYEKLEKGTIRYRAVMVNETV
jgi:D-arabinose 1-dehydrogenase-like Zn-dependent alcohol dehydrogenase